MFGSIHSKGVQEQIPIKYVFSWGDSANYATAQGTTTDIGIPVITFVFFIVGFDGEDIV